MNSNSDLTLNDLKAASRVFGLRVDDMFDTARAVEPQLVRQRRARREVQERAARA
jgi:hypothetical protein